MAYRVGMLRLALALAIALAPAAPAGEAGSPERAEALFDPVTGYRVARHRAPVPAHIPGPARRVEEEEARSLLAAGALAIDVGATELGIVDPTSGDWLTEPKHSLPGAVWLPETGWARLEPERQLYLETSLARLAPDRARPILVFCIADCWLSWNAAQRIAAMGYEDVAWFADGTDGWAERGWPLVPVRPEPMPVGR